jgi:hypothetical protein
MSGYAFNERDRLSCPTRYVSHYLLFCAFDAPLQVQLQFPDLDAPDAIPLTARSCRGQRL